jgi:hypothetical protein
MMFAIVARMVDPVIDAGDSSVPYVMVLLFALICVLHFSSPYIMMNPEYHNSKL